ncbi:MAG TPA: DUF4893 domain-containing protein [Rhizomicrobium sp.]|nr:DUF4893 domain-containing protein [Rhizomicrobium sp.]
MRKGITTSFAAAFLLAAIPAHAQWQNRISPADLERLSHLSEIRDAALADAGRGPGTGDSRAVDRVMRAEGRTIPANALAGNWRCRQIKLGRMSSYLVYDRWFTCTIRSSRDGLVLEKAGGSQRFAGTLFPENGAWVYVGASSVRGEPRHVYSGASAALGAQTSHTDQVGLLTGIGDNHLRLEIPAVQESLLDVVEFTR